MKAEVPMMDAVDAIMQVMDAAFDPQYGEAWNRRQVSDTLSFRHAHFLLCDSRGEEPDRPEDAVGFAMSRLVLDEEELLLFAVTPQARGKGAGSRLLARFIAGSEQRGATRQFLEMRDGNPAERIYLRHGFSEIGRRKNYYRANSPAPIDAITYARSKA